MEFTQDSLQPTGDTLLQMSVQTNLGYKTPLVFRVIRLLQGHGYLPGYGCGMAEVCLEEALANAMVHGNRLDAGKEVHVTVFGDGDRFGIVLDDEGEGFGAADLPDPDDPEHLLRQRGRGIVLIDHYMDQVRYNRQSKRLWMARGRQVEPDPGTVPPSPVDEGEPVPADGTIEPIAIDPLGVTPRPLAHVSVPDTIEIGQADPISEPPPSVPQPEPDPAPASGKEPAPAAPAATDVQVERHGDIVVATVRAPRITEDNAEAVTEELVRAAEGTEKMVLDLAAVQMMSSVGISAVMIAYKKVMQNKGKLVLGAVQPTVHNVLSVTGLLRLFQVEADRQAAIEKLGSSK